MQVVRARVAFQTRLAVLLAATALTIGCGGGATQSGSTVQVASSGGSTSQRLDVAASTSTSPAAMRAAWQTYLAGGTFDVTDSDISTKVAAIGTAASTYQAAMVASASRTTCLWTDLCTWTASTTVTGNFTRVQQMVLGYVTPGSGLYQDATLLANILDALQWLYDNHYNAGIAQYDNWWDWEIGVPKPLGNILVALYGQVPTTLRGDYVSALDHFNADPTYQTWPVSTVPVAMTGANLLDKVIGRVLSGMLDEDTTKIAAARTAMQTVYVDVTADDGFYQDGSFIQHHYISYMGSYGAPLIDDVSNLMVLTYGTPWSFSSAETATIAGWVGDSIAPLVYEGGMMDMSRGRAISRSATTDHVAGRVIAASVRRLVDGMDATTAAPINATVKGWMQAETVYSHVSGCTSNCYYAGFGLYDMSRMKALAADSTVTAAQLVTSRVYASMARAVHHTSSFAFALSMFSDRTSSFEFGNGENKKGWLTGAGMTAMNTDDQKQFGANFWATVDYGRLPGTTVDAASFDTPVAWSFYGNALNNLRWTGGSSVLGTYTSAGMEFDMSGFLSQEPSPRTSPSSLSGRKSWFMMDDRIVALGSDIADSAGRPVETIVDNRRLMPPYTGSAGGANKLTINNSGYTAAALGAGTQTVASVRWAHVQGSVVSSCSPALTTSCTTGSKGVGYVFPTAVTLNVLREARTAAWSDVGTGATTAVTDNYLSLALAHGTDPAAASYAYVLLPNKSAAEVSAIAASSGITILANGSGVHSVMYAPASGSVTRVVGANFWLSAGGTVSIGGQSYLTSSSKASVTVAETAAGLSVAVSDPTEANTGSVTVEIQRSASSAGTLDSAVTVIQLQPTIKLSVDVGAAHGRSIGGNFSF